MGGRQPDFDERSEDGQAILDMVEYYGVAGTVFMYNEMLSDSSRRCRKKRLTEGKVRRMLKKAGPTRRETTRQSAVFGFCGG